MDEMLWLQRLKRWARRFTRCEAQADDWVMEALHACRHHFGAYPWEASPEAHPQLLGWCQRKIRSLAIDHRHCARVRYEHLLVDTPVGERLASRDDTGAIVERLAVRQFIESLPPYLRAVAELYEAGYTYAEIAEQLGVSEGTVKGYMGRIRDFGREFFGVSGNESGVCLVNTGDAPPRGDTEEVQTDDATEAVADDECVGTDSGECSGSASQPVCDSRVERGGANRVTTCTCRSHKPDGIVSYAVTTSCGCRSGTPFCICVGGCGCGPQVDPIPKPR